MILFHKKDIIIILIISALCFVSCKKTNFYVSGKITSAKGKTIFLEQLSPLGTDTIASTKINNDGKFELKYNDTTLKLYRLKIENTAPIYLCLKSGNKVFITANYPDINKNYEISGSHDCSELKRLNSHLLQSSSKIELLRNQVKQELKISENISQKTIEQNNKIASEIFENEKKFIINFIKENQSSPIIYFALHQYISTSPIMKITNDLNVYKEVLSYMKEYNPNLEETSFLESSILKFELQQKQINREYVKLTIDSKAPDFTLQNQNDEKIALSSFSKQNITICFWASWDKKSIKEIQKYIQENCNRDIILISLDTNKSTWKLAIKKHNLGSVTNLCDEKSWEGITAKMYGIKKIPTFVELGKGKCVTKIF